GILVGGGLGGFSGRVGFRAVGFGAHGIGALFFGCIPAVASRAVALVLAEDPVFDTAKETHNSDLLQSSGVPAYTLVMKLSNTLQCAVRNARPAAVRGNPGSGHNSVLIDSSSSCRCFSPEWT